MMKTTKTVFITIASLLAATVLLVAAWQVGWFVEAKNADRRTGVVNNSVGRQQALTSKVQRDVVTVRGIDTQEQTPEVRAQRVALVDDICATAEQLTGTVTLTGSTQQFINQECQS